MVSRYQELIQRYMYWRPVKEINDSFLGGHYFMSNEIKLPFSSFFIDLSPGFVTWICLHFISMLVVTAAIHGADDTQCNAD